jgi:hypothetical protein
MIGFVAGRDAPTTAPAPDTGEAYEVGGWQTKGVFAAWKAGNAASPCAKSPRLAFVVIDQ